MKKGFSVLEILIVVGIIGVLVAIILFQFGDFRYGQVLKTETEKVITVLQDARNRTLASVDDSRYGVHVDTDQITLFKGASYSVGDPNNEIVPVDELLEIGEISLNGGGSDIVFQKLTGKTDDYGTFALILSVDSTSSSTVTVSPIGIASYTK
jgi:prepilin-type N-terminal cleavage/methylation domain-containing protein